jgi:ATP-dependent Clp protease ATP-binding subunit ClpA
MFNRFAKSARLIVHRSQQEARALGARSIEPEHLLVSLAAGPDDDPAARALADAGLDAPVIREALDADVADALDRIGIPREVVAAIGRPQTTTGNLRFGPGAKQVLANTLRAAAERDEREVNSRQLLLGVLQTPSPTIDRLLERAGTDRARLRSSVA